MAGQFLGTDPPLAYLYLQHVGPSEKKKSDKRILRKKEDRSYDVGIKRNL